MGIHVQSLEDNTKESRISKYGSGGQSFTLSLGVAG